MRKHRKFETMGLKASVAAVAMLAALPVMAQDVTQLQTIEVQGQGEGTGTGPVRGYVAKASNAGSKTDTPINEIPQSVSVVGREEFDDRGVVNKIDEALRYTPGVFAEPFGSDPDTDWVYIRGFDATQTGVFYDGLNLFSYGFGGFQVDPFMLERVDVLKGPSSVLYGGSNPGGLVNYIRKRPTDEPYYYTETGINNNGNAFFGFDVSDSVGASETMKYRVTGKIAGGDNYSDFSHDFRGFIMPQMEIAPDDATKLTIWGSFFGLDQLHTGNGFFPYVGTVVDAPFGKIPRDGFYGEPGIDEGVTNQEMIGYELEHTFDNGWKVSQNVRYGHLYKHENSPYIFGYQDPSDPQYGSLTNPVAPNYEFHRLGFNHTSKVHTFNADNRLEGEFETGGLQHDVLFGVDYKYFELFNFQASTTATPISATNPVYGAPQPANASYSNQTITQQQIGFYAQDQIHFGDGWLLTANGRYDFVHTDTHNGPTFWSAASSDYDYNKGALSGRLGLAYEFENGVTPYATVGTFFAPVIATNSTPNTKPEEGEQYEVGVKYEPTFVEGMLTASLFHINKRNMTVTGPDATGISVTRQFGEVESRGFELEGKVNIDENWKVLAALSYTDLEITRDLAVGNIGKSPVLIPNTQASLWVDYGVTTGTLEGLSLGGGVRYQSSSWVDTANTLKVPDATLFDAAVRYGKNEWEASLNVSNLFDKDYVRACNGVSGCGYGDARTITFKLSKTW
ncbi:TonB-dependent siderophore receptor [Neorhizobium sp. NPDC001467]|uniref:TonB-dependent siderophore receptor n=1 Tax=Neorhizobium sp. NPDC001467 TaxID=3390595 RepID=UPI003D000818